MNYNININNCQTVNVSLPLVSDAEYKKQTREKFKKLEKDINSVLESEVDVYTKKKKLSLLLSDVYTDLEEFIKAERVFNCSTFLEFAVNKSKTNVRLSYINSCKDRLCPTCQFRRGFKLYRQVSKALDRLKDSSNMFFFATFTTVNVALEDVNAEVTHIIKAFTAMSRRKEFKNIYLGYVRVVELVVDRKETIDSVLYVKKKQYYKRLGLGIGDKNPNYLCVNVHIHCILHTTKTVYKHNYLKKSRLLEIWQACSGEENKVIDIKQIRNINEYYDCSDTNKAVAEVCKYSVKPLDLICNDANDKIVIYYIMQALKSRRLFSCSGTLKVPVELAKDVQAQEEDDETFYRFFWHYTQKYKPII